MLKLMEQVRPYADRVLAVADLERHQASMTAPEDAQGEAPKYQDMEVEMLFAAATTNQLTTYPVAKYTPRFLKGDGVGEADDLLAV